MSKYVTNIKLGKWEPTDDVEYIRFWPKFNELGGDILTHLIGGLLVSPPPPSPVVEKSKSLFEEDFICLANSMI